MPDLVSKTAAFWHICRVYEDYLETLDLACHRGCAACCTTNVTVTSLEAWIIADYLETHGLIHLFEKIAEGVRRPRLHPAETLNRTAEIASRQGFLPEEPEPVTGHFCPLLTHCECPIYPVRPFACRCLVSARDCRQRGFAQIDPFTVTVSNVMLQYIEHVDAGGVTGNMMDMVHRLRTKKSRDQYAAGDMSALKGDFIGNALAGVLLVQPEEREAIAPILSALNRGGGS